MNQDVSLKKNNGIFEFIFFGNSIFGFLILLSTLK